MNNQIFWLASYPKSGNTLLRSILIALFFTKDGNFNLDDAFKIRQFETTLHINNNAKIFGKDFKNINKINVFYKYLNKLQQKEALGFKEDFIFMKTHSGAFEIGGYPFTEQKNVRGIIYVVRDPGDVCISWSKHSNISLDRSLSFMLDEYSSLFWTERSTKNNIFSDKCRPRYLVSSWHNHVLSWTTINWKVPKLILKYEDIVYNKKKVIDNLLLFFENNFQFKFENKNIKIDNIIKSTEFEKFQKYEKEKGFIESTKNHNFFSVGKKDQWKKILNKGQVAKLEEKFGNVMKKFNYTLKNN